MMTADEAHELWRLTKILAICIPPAIAWGAAIRWLAFKIADRWFH